MQSNNEIGQRIETLRKERGLTQGSLAEKLHVKRETVCQWETGVRDLKTGHLIALAETLDVSADYLLGLTNSTQKESEPQRIIADYTGLNDSAIKLLNERKTMPVFNSKTAIISSLVAFFCKDHDSSFTHYLRENSQKALNEFILDETMEKVISALISCGYIGYLADYIIEEIGCSGVHNLKSIRELLALDKFIDEYELYYDLSIFEAQNAIVEMIKTKHEAPSNSTREILYNIQRELPKRMKELETDKVYDVIRNGTAVLTMEDGKPIISFTPKTPDSEEF